MGITPLIPLAGAAVGSLAAKAVQQWSREGSFLDVLRSGLPGGGSASETQGSASAAVTDPYWQGRLRDFANVMRHHLAARGVRLDQPVILKDDGRGGVVVEGRQEQREAIESIFRDEPELAATFQFLSAMHGGEPSDSASAAGGPFQVVLSDRSVDVLSGRS